MCDVKDHAADDDDDQVTPLWILNHAHMHFGGPTQSFKQPLVGTADLLILMIPKEIIVFSPRYLATTWKDEGADNR